MINSGEFHQRRFLIFTILILAAYFIGLGALPFLGPDEPRYAQVAREMFERGDWITPTLGGRPWFEKPALAYWLMIIGYKIFGVNEFAARFGSAIFGLLTILTIYLLTNFARAEDLLNNKIETVDDDLPFWSVLISASSIGLLVFAHAATFDVILTFPITAALACFYKFQISDSKLQTPEMRNAKAETRNRRWLIGFYFFIGVALLAKGLIGAVLPLGVVFAYFLVSRKLPSRTFIFSLLWGAIIACGTAAVWYFPMLLRHGRLFVTEFFVQQQFARYTSNKYQHPEPFWFFWAILPALALPWVLFLLVTITCMFFAVFKTWGFKQENKRLKPNVVTKSFRSDILNFLLNEITSFKLFLFCWLLIPLIFFTFSGSKLPGYILPALPPLLILIAEPVCLLGKLFERFQLYMKILVGAVLLAVPISLNTFAVNLAREDTAKFLIQAADEQGLGAAKVLNLHDVSHSLEFYAAKRTVRLPNGNQWKFESSAEVRNYLQLSGAPQTLVLVPLEHEHQLFENPLLESRRVAANNSFALVAVGQK